MAYVHTVSFTNQPAEELAEIVLDDEPGGLTHAYFCSSGSEGNEAAIKLARQYFLEIGQPQRTRIHRPPPGLPRQHARRARRRRQHDAPRALRADPVAGVQPRLALLRLSLPARRRDRRAIRPAPRRRTGGRVPAPRPRQGRSRSSPSPSSAPPPAASPPSPATSGACARSATATARC